MLGEDENRGLDAIGSLLGIEAVEALYIHRVISHGRAGAVELSASAADGTRREVCLVFEFASLKADKIRYLKAYR